MKKKRNVANKIGLTVGPPIVSGEDLLKSDVTLLKEKIPSLADGVYSFDFKTKKGPHATLLIKSENKVHLWNPDQGLIDCGDEPDKFLAEYLENEYPKPGTSIPGHGKETNHRINIYAYTRNTPAPSI